MKRLIILAAIIWVLLPGMSPAAEKVPDYVRVLAPSGAVFPMDGDALDEEKLSGITSATGLTSSKVTSSSYGQAKVILFQVETAAARCSWHGTDPTVTGTSDKGFIFNAGDSYMLPGYGNIGRFKCINATAGNWAVVRVFFYY